jgi:hypothetical protein
MPKLWLRLRKYNNFYLTFNFCLRIRKRKRLYQKLSRSITKIHKIFSRRTQRLKNQAKSLCSLRVLGVRCAPKDVFDTASSLLRFVGILTGF